MTNLRLDEHTCISEGPTAVPGVSGLHASVFRPFNDESRAREYATEVRDWFAESGCPASVFVVRGPTSTAKTAFEVVNASAGYTIVFTASPPAVPSPQEFSQQKGALEDRLAQHAILRQSGAIDDCFWMRHFLRELLVGHCSQLPQDTPYAAHHARKSSQT